MSTLRAPKFTMNRKDMLRNNDSLKDMVVGHMALDIDRAIKSTAGTPVKTGDMKAETRAFKTKDGQWRVESGKEYSAVQEAGIRKSGPGAPTRRFSNYTTSGTGAGWFTRAANGITRNANRYVDEAVRALGL